MLTLFPFAVAQEENWPAVEIPPQAESLLELRAQQRLETPISYKLYIKDHSPFGDYLNMGSGNCKPRDRLTADSAGVLMKEFEGKPNYHPVLSAQCGLKAFGRFLREGRSEDLAEAELYADTLIRLQGKTGGFGYPFRYRYYLSGDYLPVGWTSGMAQGQALSLLARLAMTTGEDRFLESGKLALRYLLTPVVEGGVMATMAGLDPSLNGYVFFEEYVTEPANYTLNGYIFALLGLYDWSQISDRVDADQDRAKAYFHEGVRTLIRVLPYYDLGSWSAYDLGHITFKAELPNISNSYHGVHIYLLNAMLSITGEPLIRDYLLRWKGYDGIEAARTAD